MKYRSFRKVDIEGLIDDLCLDELAEIDCMLEEFWDKFQTKLKAAIDKFVPEKNVKMTTERQYAMVQPGTKTNEVKSKEP